MFTAVTVVRANPDKYEKDFNAIVAFLTQYIDKRAYANSYMSSGRKLDSLRVRKLQKAAEL